MAKCMIRPDDGLWDIVDKVGKRYGMDQFRTIYNALVQLERTLDPKEYNPNAPDLPPVTHRGNAKVVTGEAYRYGYRVIVRSYGPPCP